jgi:hypothetical protein
LPGKNLPSEQRLVQIIEKMFGVLAPAAELGQFHTLRIGYKPSTTLSASLIDCGPMPKVHFNFMDTVTGVKLSGEMTLQVICEIWEEVQESDEK